MGDSEIRTLRVVPRAATANKYAIEALENMLARAREGEVIGVAVAAVLADGSTATCYEKGENIATLLGSVQRLNVRLLGHMEP